ncbi:homeotic protein proboscipedia [Biomphalaria glabrata]|nr:homeotic protein proboscipedia [Biomphalaria glabrata]
MMQLDSLSGLSSTTAGNVSNSSGPTQSHSNRLLDQPNAASLDSRHAIPGFTSVINWRSDYPVHQATGVDVCTTSGDKQTSDDEDYRPFTPPPPRERLSYTRYQLALLNGIYQEVRYPNGTQKQLIAKRVGITREQVKIWFQNRRRKDVVTKKVPSKTASSKSEVKDNANDVKDNSPTVGLQSPVSDNSSESFIRTDDDPQTLEHMDTHLCDTLKSHNTSDSRTELSPGNKDNHSPPSSTSSTSLIVSPVVLRSMIVELNKFNNEYLKLKKSKKKRKKSKGTKPALTTSAPAKLSSLPSFSSLSSCQAPRLFQNYDMLAPPNKLTPTANTTLHASETSAFRNPRSQFSSSRPWENMSTSNSSHSSFHTTDFMQSYGGLENLHSPSEMSSSSIATSSVENTLSKSLTQTHQQLYNNAQTSSDLDPNLKMQPSAMILDARMSSAARSIDYPTSSRMSQLSTAQSTHPNPHFSHLLQRHDIGFSNMDSEKCFQPSSPHHTLSLHPHHSAHFAAINRVYPFPLVAEPPVMLSNIRPTESYMQHSSWHQLSTPPHLPSSQQSTAGSHETYRPLLISSINNPYFSSTPLTYISSQSSTSSTPRWTSQTSDLNNNHFTQL